VRIKKGENQFEWIELKSLEPDDVEKINYAKAEITKQIKEKLANHDLSELKKIYFERPISLSEKLIEIKKTRQIAFNNDLYEITKGRYVFSRDAFMTYFFIQRNTVETVGAKAATNREIKFLKFIDAVKLIENKPEKLLYKDLIIKEKTNSELQENIGFDLLFTLAKNDLVYMPDEKLNEDDIEKLDWNNLKSLLSKLFIVKDMNPSRNEIVFQQFYKADSIFVSENDAKELLNIENKNGLSEEIKYGAVDMLQRCIKVFTDKLGKKIVPYWMFPSGCWDKETAKKLGLIFTEDSSNEKSLSLFDEPGNIFPNIFPTTESVKD
jgi:hypothetical protein